jgi:hypothetical protein
VRVRYLQVLISLTGSFLSVTHTRHRSSPSWMCRHEPLLRATDPGEADRRLAQALWALCLLSPYHVGLNFLFHVLMGSDVWTLLQEDTQGTAHSSPRAGMRPSELPWSPLLFSWLTVPLISPPCL